MEGQVVDRSQASEDYPLSAVPLDARKSIWSMAFMLLGFTLYSGTFFAGGLIGPAYRFWDLVGLIVAGNLILGIYAAALSYIAAKSGLSTILMARFSFGNLGCRWINFLLGFTQIGWYAWGSALTAELLNQLAGVPTSWDWLIILFFTYFCCITAYIGYRPMDWYSRFADSGRTAMLGTLAAFFLANGLVIFAGAVCSLVYGNEDMVEVMAQQRLLFWGLVLLFLSM